MRYAVPNQQLSRYIISNIHIVGMLTFMPYKNFINVHYLYIHT